MNNILSPDLIWIEGSCYRVNDCQPDLSSFVEHDLYEADDFAPREMEDDFDPSIQQVREDRFETNFHVPRHYHGYIIGAKGSTRRRIESETKASIILPRLGRNGDVTIRGLTYENVASAKRRINIIIDGARQKQMPTHFLSIPMTCNEIVDNFIKFKELVLSDKSEGVDESIFVSPQKLHLTLGVMTLMDDQERLRASQLLSEAKIQIVEPLLEKSDPIKILMKGISHMKDDPHKVQVLYANVTEVDRTDGILQRLSDEVCRFFDQHGILKKDRDRDSVKLHVTLINTKYRKDSGDDGSEKSDRNNWIKRVPFDARKILENYGDFDFGCKVIQDIHLSQMHTGQIKAENGPDGYYQSTSTILL